MIIVLIGEQKLCNVFSDQFKDMYGIEKTKTKGKLERSVNYRPFRNITYKATLDIIVSALTGCPSQTEDDFKVVGTSETLGEIRNKVLTLVPQIISPFLTVLKKCPKNDNIIITGFSIEEIARWSANPNLIIFNVENGSSEELEELLKRVLAWENN